MGHSETTFNRPKVNYLARRRHKIGQIKQGQNVQTIDAKTARQAKRLVRKEKLKAIKKEKKAVAKAEKMEIEN